MLAKINSSNQNHFIEYDSDESTHEWIDITLDYDFDIRRTRVYLQPNSNSYVSIDFAQKDFEVDFLECSLSLSYDNTIYTRSPHITPNTALQNIKNNLLTLSPTFNPQHVNDIIKLWTRALKLVKKGFTFVTPLPSHHLLLHTHDNKMALLIGYPIDLSKLIIQYIIPDTCNICQCKLCDPLFIYIPDSKIEMYLHIECVKNSSTKIPNLIWQYHTNTNITK